MTSEDLKIFDSKNLENIETRDLPTEDHGEKILHQEPKKLLAQCKTTEGDNETTKYSRRQNQPPPGMSLSAYKRLLKKKRFEENREEWNLKKKEKKKEKKAAKRKLNEEAKNNESMLNQNPSKRTKKQKRSNIKIIIDCGFDELMKEEVCILTFINNFTVMGIKNTLFECLTLYHVLVIRKLTL